MTHFDTLRAALEVTPDHTYGVVIRERGRAALAALETEVAELRAKVVSDFVKLAPRPPEVVVSDEVCENVWLRFQDVPMFANAAMSGRAMITAVQSILGPTLGLVPREDYDTKCRALIAERAEHDRTSSNLASLRKDVARMVEAAYRECASELCHYDTALVDQWWAEIDARKRLEGGR